MCLFVSILFLCLWVVSSTIHFRQSVVGTYGTWIRDTVRVKCVVEGSGSRRTRPWLNWLDWILVPCHLECPPVPEVHLCRPLPFPMIVGLECFLLTNRTGKGRDVGSDLVSRYGDRRRIILLTWTNCVSVKPRLSSWVGTNIRQSKKTSNKSSKN